MLDSANPLTKAEQKIFEIISTGIQSNTDIGELLNLSPHTVKNHKENIKAKLEVQSCKDLL